MRCISTYSLEMSKIHRFYVLTVSPPCSVLGFTDNNHETGEDRGTRLRGPDSSPDLLMAVTVETRDWPRDAKWCLRPRAS